MPTDIADTFSSAGTYPAAEGPLQHRSYATASLPSASSLPAGTTVWDSTVEQLKVTDGTNWKAIGGAAQLTSVKTSAYSANYGEFVICDPTSAGFNVTLPAASGGSGQSITVKHQSNSSNAVTVVLTGVDTLDGAGSVVLYAREVLTVVSDGVSDWMVTR